MATQILAPTTGNVATAPFLVRTERTVTTMQQGMAGAEFADLQISPDGGNTWISVLLANTNPSLDVSNPTRTILFPGLFRYFKTTTVSPVAIYVATQDNA